MLSLNESSVLVEAVAKMEGASNLKLNDEINALLEEGKEVFHFGFGQSPFKPMPIAIDALNRYSHHNEYLPVNGLLELRKKISCFHKKFDNFEIDADNIVVTPGSKQSIFILISILKNDVILVSPSWLSYKGQCSILEKKTHILRTSYDDEWKVTAKKLENLIITNDVPCYSTFVLCNPDNPTSVTYSDQDLSEIADICRKYKIIVISDEIYSQLNYERKHTSIVKHYPEGTIITNGVSKWAALGGWRLGYSIFPANFDAVKKAFCTVGSNSFSCVAAPVQYAVAEMLGNEEECELFIDKCCQIMKAIGEYCHKELTSINIKCVKPAGGFYIMPNFDVVKHELNLMGINTTQQMCDKLFADKSVTLMPAGPDFLRPEDEFTTRLSFVNFDGQHVLKTFENNGRVIDDNFIEVNFPQVVQGIQLSGCGFRSSTYIYIYCQTYTSDYLSITYHLPITTT